MVKKAFIAASTIVSIFLLVGAHAVKMANANPTWGVVPKEPNQDKPILAIEEPENYTTCTETTVVLNFTIIKPSSWNWTLAPFGSCANGNIQSVNVSLNGIQVFQEYLSSDKLNGGSYWNKSYSLNITGLNFGINSLNVTILANALFLSKSVTVGDTTTNYISNYPMNVTDTIYVISGFSPNSTVTPTLVPSSPTPFSNPTRTPSLTPTQSPSSKKSLIVTVNSPLNKTYSSNEINVSVSASDPNGQIGPEFVAYILDRNQQVIIGQTSGMGMHSFANSTVLTVSDGSHCIVGVGITWFNGADGVFYSQPIYFTVNANTSSTPTPTIEPSQIPDRPQIGDFAPVIIPASTALLSIIVISLLVYFGRRRREH